MPKYDWKSLTDAAEAIYEGVDRTKSKYYPPGASQYGSWQGSTFLPSHADMSLFSKIYGNSHPGETRYENIEDFKPESWQTFLTSVFYKDFDTVYESAIKAVTATAAQANYGSVGLSHMAQTMKAVDDKNITAVFSALNTTQNRD